MSTTSSPAAPTRSQALVLSALDERVWLTARHVRDSLALPATVAALRNVTYTLDGLVCLGLATSVSLGSGRTGYLRVQA